jgi:hypothetical protein
MRKLTTITALALLMASSASAIADGAPSLKDKPVAAPTPDWDIAFGGYVASDYMFRGISQSAHWPSGSAYTELRYNVQPTIQLYSGISIESIDYPNRAASETDFYFGVRPTFDKLALDFGGWYYWYPGGRLFNGVTAPGTPLGTPNANCTNGFVGFNDSCNIYEADLSFWEVYGKATYAFTDTFTLGGNVFYDPSWLNTGADGTYASVTAKYVLPGTWFPSKDIGAFISGEFGHYWFGRTNAFYGNTVFPGQANGIELPEYNTWNVGVSFTYKVFTLDLRYVDTDLSKSNCDVLTSDHTATPSLSNVSSINPSGLGSNWCGATFVAKLSFDLTANTNLK